MTILYVGATGAVGIEATLKLKRTQRKITALVRGGRSNPKAKSLLDAGIDVVEGDLTRADTLGTATRAIDTVVCSATSMPAVENDGLQRVDHDGTLALIAAAEAAEVSTFVYVSYSGNIHEDSPLQTAKRDCEKRLLASRMKSVILRPSYFMEMWLSPALGFDPVHGLARIYGSGDAGISYISSSNVADFILATVQATPPERNTILELGGPEALSQLEAVRIFEQALQKPIQVDHVPREVLETQHRSSDPLQKTFGGLMLAYSKGDLIKDAADTARRYRVDLRSVRDYASTFVSRVARAVK